MQKAFKLLISESVESENNRFYTITQGAYVWGALGHLMLGFVFWYLKIYEMVWFNFVYSVPAFCLALFLNRQGHHGFAFFLGFLELLFHQIAAVYFLGWDSGFQYALIYLAGLTFFNAQWTEKLRIFFITVLMFTFVILYFFCKTPDKYFLSNLQYDFFYLSCSLLSLLSLIILINYYVQTAHSAESRLKAANQKLSQKNTEIEQALNERNQALMQLNQELAEAADYVRTILPHPIAGGNISTDWRFIPCSSVGGDAFGYHWLDDDHFVIYLIDVSGHGVGAALLSVSVMNALRSQSLPDTDFKDPEQVLTSLNVAFPGEENNDMFFTIWYGVYKKSTRELTYAGGGHPPALLFGNTNSIDTGATLLRSANNVIGALPDVTYEKNKHVVGEQTTLYIYSDGVYEVEKSDGLMWQFREFTDFMSKITAGTQSRLDRLHRHAENINALDNFEDDFTILEVAFS